MCGLTSHITSRDDGRLDDRAKSVMSDKYYFKKEIVDKENNLMKMLDLFDANIFIRLFSLSIISFLKQYLSDITDLALSSKRPSSLLVM